MLHNEKLPPPGTICPLNPVKYSRCGNIWNMEGNREQARRWYEEILAGNRRVYIYRLDGGDGEFIAEGALVRETGDPDYTISGQRIYLSRLIVKPEYRRRGVGGALVDFLLERAKQEGYREVALGVDLDNAPARLLYAGKGFTHVLFEGKDEHGPYQKLLRRL